MNSGTLSPLSVLCSTSDDAAGTAAPVTPPAVSSGASNTDRENTLSPDGWGREAPDTHKDAA